MEEGDISLSVSVDISTIGKTCKSIIAAMTTQVMAFSANFQGQSRVVAVPSGHGGFTNHAGFP